MNYRLYNEIKSIKKSINKHPENNPKINIKNDDSIDILKNYKNIPKEDKDTQKALNESINKSHKKKFENSSVNFNVKTDKIIINIINNVNSKYKKDNK